MNCTQADLDIHTLKQKDKKWLCDGAKYKPEVS